MIARTELQPRNTAASTFVPGRGLLLQRKCACGSPTSSLTGECTECKSNKLLQAKLTIGASNDPLEQEADRIADRVMATPAHSAVSGAAPRIQRYTGQATRQAETAPASVDRVLASPGRPLGPALRQDMEQRFGYDFSRVRVHADAAAGQSARDVNADAYAVGHNVVFGADRYESGTREGRRLIAHELTHVVQQSGADGLPDGRSNGTRGPSTTPDAQQNSVPRSASWPVASDTHSTARVSQRAPAPLLSRQPSAGMSTSDSQMLEDCSHTHRDWDLDIRADKYRKDAECIYGIVKRTIGAGFEREADQLIQWAASNQFLAGDVLRSMFSAAATANPLDRLGAGTVFAIVSAGGFSGLVNMIRDGNLKVRVLPDDALNTLLEPMFGDKSKQVRALYLKDKDTLVLRFETMSIDDLGFRSTVIHELTHFRDDAALAEGSHLDAERRAHLEQALYLLRELKSDDSALDSVARDYVNHPTPYLIIAAVIQSKNLKHFESTCRTLVERISDIAIEQGQPKGLPSFDVLKSKSLSDLKELMDKQMRAAGYTDAPAEFEGLTR